MRVIVGLGNPGEQYEHSRHNAGFLCLDALAKATEASPWQAGQGGELAEIRRGSQKMLLFKPLQFMNRSGEAIAKLQHFYKITEEELCIVADDVYVAPGSVRIRKGGGDGGHNGWRSVLQHVPSDQFWRVRLGVGVYAQPTEERMHQIPLDEYVLRPLPAHEAKQLKQAIDNVVPKLIQWLEQGELVEETLHL